ncbi:MAG: EamA family transporter [Pseudomonadota bacterium]
MNLTVFFYATLILFSMSVLPLFMKQLSGQFSDMQLLFAISSVLALFSFCFLIFRNEFSGIFEIIALKQSLGILLLIVAFLGFLDTWPYIKALQAGADVGVLLSYVRAGGTVFTALLGVYFLGEKLSLMQWVGIAFCVVGIALILFFKTPDST